MHAASVLAQKLPPSHRVILIERNSHFNRESLLPSFFFFLSSPLIISIFGFHADLYVFPRFSVLPGHEHKAFIPYSSIFKDAPLRGPSSRPAQKKPAAPLGKQAAGKSSEDTIHAASASAEGAKQQEVADKQAEARQGLLEFSSSSGASARESAKAGWDDDNYSSASASSSSSSSDWSRRHHAAAKNTSSSSNTSLASSYTTFSTAGGHSSTKHSSADGRRPQEEALQEGEGEAEQDLEQPVSRQEIEEELKKDVEGLAQAKREEEATGEREQFVQVKDLGKVLDDVNESESSAAAQKEGGEFIEELEKGDGAQRGQQGEVADEDAASSGGSPHLVLQATVTSITESHVIVTPARKSDPNFDSLDTKANNPSSCSTSSSKKAPLWTVENVSIPYSHLIYALGSHLPDPLRTEARTKQDGIGWMKRIQSRVEESNEIVLVGGGALGVEFATDIASVWPTLREGEEEGAVDEQGRRKKKVTLIHSRKQLLPNFDEKVHEAAYGRLTELGVNVVLGERLALTQGCPKGSKVSVEETTPLRATGDTTNAKLVTDTSDHSISKGDHERKIIRTTGGKVFTADLLLLCTGQQPNSALMAQLSPSSVDPQTRLVRVLPTLQVAVPDPRDAAQMPFEMRPPCGDCDCFLDRKTAGATENIVDSHQHRYHLEGLRNVYAIGDCVDGFGAINAGYQAWNMADVAAENVLRNIGVATGGESEKEDVTSLSSSHSEHADLQEFEPAPSMLKLSLGLGKMVFQGAPVPDPNDSNAPHRPEVAVKEDPHDLAVEGVWTFMAKASTDDMYL